MFVRPATPSDANAISQIASLTFHLACPADTALAQLESYIADNLTPDCFLKVISSRGTLVSVLEYDDVVCNLLTGSLRCQRCRRSSAVNPMLC